MPKPNDPVDPRIRLSISQWPDDAPRGSVSSFCAEHGISRKSFYKILNQAREHGAAAALQPRSRRPKSSPTKLDDQLKHQALQVRAALASSGLDHGPISVFEKMRSLGLTPPAVASLARIFRQAGVAEVQPRKRPRAAYRRFVYPAPNCCWQLDAAEYVLTGGRKAVIFQLQDDHSRLAVASHVATGETAEAALAVVQKGIDEHGVPQKLLTDNGAALNPSRRGAVGQLFTYLTSLGVEPITGKPGKPTTQGKNERFHQTLFRFLDAQPLAASIDQLQQQVDAFDLIYNTQRPHQGLPGRITPAAAWAATPVVDPPRPAPAPVEPQAPATATAAVVERPESLPLGPDSGWAGDEIRKVNKVGQVHVKGIRYQISNALARQYVHVLWDQETIIFVDNNGEVLIEHPWPPKTTGHISNRGQRKPAPHRPKPGLSPMS